MATIRTGIATIFYRIERLTGEVHGVEEWKVIISGLTSMDEADQKYDAYRNSFPLATYRLVQVTDHVQRIGTGKVMA